MCHPSMVNKTVLQSDRNPRPVSRVYCLSPLTKSLSLFLALIIAFGATLARAAENFRGPDVVVVAGQNKTIYEFRQNGQLRMIRVIPKRGKPYYLVPVDPTKNGGDLARADKLVPSWIITRFD